MSESFENLQTRYERLKLLYQVGNVIHSTLEPREALQLVLGEAVRITRASSGSIALFNPTNSFLEIAASHGLSTAGARLKLHLGEGITGWVARTGRPALVGDVTQDRRYVIARKDVRSELAVPLEVQGIVRGVLNVDSARIRAFSEQDLDLLQELAGQAARVIHNTWLYEQLRLKARLFESLVSVSQTINSALNLDDALKVITRESCLLMDVKMCSLMMIDPQREWLDLRASHGAGPAYIDKPRLSVEESLLGIVVRRKKPLQVANVQTSTRYQNTGVARREELVSLLSVPLVFGGQSIGALSVYTGKPHVFSNEEIRILSALADLSAIAIEKARLYERIVDAEEQLRQNEKFSALGLLAAEVAHEIRNPLTVMKMLYHSLDLNFGEGDPRRKDARIISEKIDHMNRIVEQVLDFARTSEPQFQPVNLNELIGELSLLTRHKLTQQEIQLIHQFDPALPPVSGDATQLEQAFLNLILNAVEAMPDGGRLTIRTRFVPARDGQPAPARILVEIRDTGRGMTKAQCDRAFTSLLKSTKPKGTGLGLPLVARIIESHRGRIDLKSISNRGTTISITLPV